MSYRLEAASVLLAELNLGSAIIDRDGVIEFVEPNIPITQDQIDVKAEELKAAQIFEWQELRRKRDSLLAETDWVTLKAIDASNDGLGIQLPQVWVEYRQALRDLPANTVDPANPVWPEKPQ